MAVDLVSVTQSAEPLLIRMARVSSQNPENPEYSKLLHYLIQHKHWSPFEMVHMVVKIDTTRAIAAQILRHRSFSFQEFSQRYSPVTSFPTIAQGRRQSEKNRQSSETAVDPMTQEHWSQLQQEVYSRAQWAYESAINAGIAKEQARLLLPLATPTTLYMAGSARSWIHYLQLRTQQDTQQEHREVAEQILELFRVEFPETSKALGWLA